MIVIEKIDALAWQDFSENAHRIAFSEVREAKVERIDYALLATEDSILYGYVTVRELDSTSVYWQYGGAFPPSEKSSKAVRTYQKFIEYSRAQYERISTLVHNENIRYLKLAMSQGFRIIGCRMFNKEIYVELLLELTKGDSVCGQLS
jgi:hypothetical protein